MGRKYSNPTTDFVLEVIQTLDLDDVELIAQAANRRLNERTIIDIPSSSSNHTSTSESKNTLANALKLLNELNSSQKSRTVNPAPSVNDSNPLNGLLGGLSELSGGSGLSGLNGLQGLLKNENVMKQVLSLLGNNKTPESVDLDEPAIDSSLFGPLLKNSKLSNSLPQLLAMGTKFFGSKTKTREETLFDAFLPYLSSTMQDKFSTIRPLVRIFGLMTESGFKLPPFKFAK